ncbi:VOC family protein [Nocardioides sp. Arc9.136]|uniref:VOC family protein n=1 Tax=Nocardioides sp. Arc9.136 TaxID=2996826 RepID=UPI002665B684|nr:VOC family protein [Nocardioides sp. Arc9.136]WKN50454.1 VOC family protein [Nocardioides sp. Arc9.136]
MDAVTTMTRYSDAVAARDWADLTDLLSPGLVARLLHTGEVLDREGYVAFNRDYPGPWTFQREQVVGAGPAAALRARVDDGTATYHVASFGTVDPAGLLTELVEVWTDGVAAGGGRPHPHHGIDYVEVAVDDLAVAERFYADAFGWRFQRYGPSYAGILAPSGRGEVGGLDATGSGSPEGRPLVLLHSRDLDATVAAVQAAGGTVTVPPYAFPGGRRFHFTDPGGTELGVWSGS